MQIFNRAKSKTILAAMIISYIILFLSPILLGIMGYVRMESILEKNINNFLETKVELLNNEMTQCINAMNTAVSQISADDYLTEFSEGKLEPEYSSAKKFIANIDLNRNRIEGVKYMGVYFKNRDVFVTNQGFFSSEDFYKILGETELTYEQWKTEYISGVAFDKWSFPGEDGENILYTQSLPFSSDSNINKYFFAVLPKETFKKIMVKSGFSKDDKFIIYDIYKGELCGEVTDPEVLKDLKDKSREQEKIETFNDESALIRLKSIKPNWRVGIVTYELSVLREVPRLRTFLIICLIIYSMCGIAMIAFYIRKNYRPIKTIISELEKSENSVQYEKGNEFDYIKNQIIANNKFIVKNYNILQTSKNLIKMQTIYKLLSGSGTDSADRTEIEAVFPGEYYILLIYIKNTRIFDTESIEESNLLSYAIKNISEELIGEKSTGYVLNTERKKIAAIINVSKSPEYDISKECENIVKTIEENLDVDLTAAVSTVKHGTERLSEAYQEAQTALDFHYIRSDRHIVFYNEIVNENLSEDGLYRYKSNIENHLIAAVVSGDCEKVKQLIRTTFEENIAFIRCNDKVKTHLYFEFIQTYIHMANEYGISVDVDKIFNNPIVRNDGLIEEYIGILDKYYTELCEVRARQRSKQSDTGLADEIKKYIDENFADYNLNVNLVSEKLGIRRQNLNTIIKQNTGKTMRDYISEVRHEKTKEFLTETNYPISQIAMMVGYSSDDVLNRAFKKIEGMTPGQYRDEYGKKNSGV